jgi:hypothetical protein
MIDRTYSVLAGRTGSARGLSRLLSSVDRITAESSSATCQRQLSSRWKSISPLPTCPFSGRVRRRTLQKTIQYPEARSGSVQ